VSSAADNELMLKVRDGDLGKLSFLFEHYHRALFNFFLRSTGGRDLSEDLVQEVFLRILKYRHTFRPDSQFSAWMYHVARNAQIDHFRNTSTQMRSATRVRATYSPRLPVPV
jgi:RNA polymerase sigma-70 factor, ECF subfamily